MSLPPSAPLTDFRGQWKSFFRQLTVAKIEEMRAKGLCFYCDEKFAPSHKYGKQPTAIIFLREDEEGKMEPWGGEEEVELSIYAYLGSRAPQNLCVEGLIKNHEVDILIDSGGTHNFMDGKLVRQIGLGVTPTIGFDVAIKDGTALWIDSRCDGVEVQIHGEMFRLDLHPLVLEGANLVLGVQWLQGLGPILVDFVMIRMDFEYEGRLVRLGGLRPNPASLQALIGLPQASCHGLLMQLVSTTEESNPGNTIATDLDSFLQGFDQVFEEPHGILLIRDHDHRIEITPGAGPTNVNSYQYLYAQKDEITWPCPGNFSRADERCILPTPSMGYGKIVVPLTTLLRKGGPEWDNKEKRAFEELKQALTEAPVLVALLNFSKTFVVKCDAFGSGIGAILMQVGQPIAYMSKALSQWLRQLSMYEREMLAVVHVVSKWRQYLIERRFKVCADQRSLPYLFGQRIHTPAQQRWLSKLLGYDYNLVYKNG
ncbi:uncharacterized protein [Typha latifolia]|uniref:uncharacterized protein n=1 Tax=Typha latifolia TaxID=4733 RepID=UPI003C2E0DB0